MKFLRCTIHLENTPKHFFSADEAIGFIEKGLRGGASLNGSIIVRTLSEEVGFRSDEARFWFGSQEAMLENLMNF
ncbi:hypothetical protein L4D76_00240 [Photobacterium sagamiensis]|uniref:hypothetical protein n=1 Tax=Photobacterium sagamiensis TaxID=2910241 RepID=UPI003D128F2A